MLKNIRLTLLICALTLTPVPAAFAQYDEICLRSRAGFVSSFIWAFAERNNLNGLDSSRPSRNIRDGVGADTIRIGETKCFNLSSANDAPGDRLRFYVKAYGGKTVLCDAHSDYQDTHEGFFLNPDGARTGKLTFYSSGATLNHSCRRESGAIRMHSECNATLNGMTNAGCANWKPEIVPDVLTDIVANDRGLGMLGSALRDGANINGADTDGLTALHAAALHDRPEYALPVIQGGANVNIRANDGATPALKAVEGNLRELRVLRMLLDNGANPNAARDDGEFPMHLAARIGREDTVQLLAEKGARINALHAETGDTPLEIAKQRRRARVVSYLRSIGAAEEIYDQMVPDIVRHNLGVDRLRDALSRGADVNAADENGDAALHVAALRNNQEYINELIFTGDADKNARNNLGQTPLMAVTAQNPQDTGALRLLVVAGADSAVRQNDGMFPLYLAVQRGRTDFLELLSLAHDFQINARNSENGLTAYGLAENFSEDGENEAYERIRSFLERRGGAR